MQYDDDRRSRRATKPGRDRVSDSTTTTPEEAAAAEAHNAKLTAERVEACIARIRADRRWVGDRAAQPKLPGHQREDVPEARRKQMREAQKRCRDKAKRLAAQPTLFGAAENGDRLASDELPAPLPERN